jgi:glycosyltransferase involved in cell wall biosynthesis
MPPDPLPNPTPSASCDPTLTAVAVLSAGKHSASVGGVPTWAARLRDTLTAEAAAGRETGWRLAVVVLMLDEQAEVPAALRGSPDVHVVRLPDSGHPLDLLDHARDVISSLNASVLLPENTDLCLMAAHAVRFGAMARHTARPADPARPPIPRLIAAARTDDWYNRSLLEHYWHADGGVGVSEPCAAWLQSVLNAGHRGVLPVAVIPSGAPVSPSPRQPGPARRRLNIAWIGRLEHAQKRCRDLPAVALALRERGVPFVLRVAGDGPERDDLIAALRHHGLLAGAQRPQDGSVEMLGALSARDIAELLADTDVLLSTSAAEGTSIALQEAMGAGVAPVVTALPGIERFVVPEHSGLIAPVGDADALAAAIARLHGDRALLAALARNAWEIARGCFAPAAVARRYVDLFNEVTSRPPAEPSRPVPPLSLIRHQADPPRTAFPQAHAQAILCHRWLEEHAAATGQRAAPLADLRALPPSLRHSLPGVVIPHSLMDHRPIDQVRNTIAAVTAPRSDSAPPRVALYGAGALARALARTEGPSLSELGVVAFLDDAAEADADTPPMLGGLPILPPERALTLGLSAVVLCSDRHEAAMARAASPLREAGLPVIAVFDPSLTSVPAQGLPVNGGPTGAAGNLGKPPASHPYGYQLQPDPRVKVA